MDWKKLGEIIATADGGCQCCVKSLSRKIAKQFPDLDRESYIIGIKANGYLDDEDIKELFVEDIWE